MARPVLPDAIGSARTLRDGEHLTIVTFGNGVRMRLRVAARLAQGVAARVLDLRWLNPLPVDILREANATGACWSPTRRAQRRGRGGSARGARREVPRQVARVASADSFIPLGDAANLVLVAEQDVMAAALEYVGERV